MGVRDLFVGRPNAEHRSRIEGFLRLTRRFEPELWVVLFVVMVLDVVSTMYGIRLGLSEGNPIAKIAIERFGALGLLSLKSFSIATALVGSVRVERRFRGLVPLGISVIWVVAVAVNALLIVAVA